MMKFNNWHSLPSRPKPPCTPRRSLGTGSDQSLPGISLAITEGGLVWLVLTCWWVITWQHCGTALYHVQRVGHVGHSHHPQANEVGLLHHHLIQHGLQRQPPEPHEGTARTPLPLLQAQPQQHKSSHGYIIVTLSGHEQYLAFHQHFLFHFPVMIIVEFHG